MPTINIHVHVSLESTYIVVLENVFQGNHEISSSQK